MSETLVHVASGKVRELFTIDDERLLLVASDRISTFDVVLPTEIPDKGRVLTGLSAFWFARTRELVANHLLGLRADGRSTECRRLEMLPLECVVRGYLAGSGWKDYQRSGSTSGHALPEGLRESDQLPEPIFTPSTKATTGHDENIDAEQAAALVGEERYEEVERTVARAVRVRVRARSGARDPDRRHEVRVRARRRRTARPRRRGLHAGLVALLAGRRVRARRPAAVVRQAVRPRLLRDARLGQDRPRPRAAGGRRGRDARALRRGVRAADRHRVRRLPRRPVGRDRVKATVLVRPKDGILDPQGDAVQESLRHLGFAVEAHAGRTRRRPRRRRGRRRHGPRRGRADVRAAARQPADRELRDRDRRVRDLRPTVAVVVFPGSNDDRDAAWALGALGAEPVLVWHAEERAAGRYRCGRPPGRVLVRRLPALRRDRPLLAGDAGGRGVRRRGRPGARHLQRLPDPLRGRAAAGRAPPERVALVRLPRRRRPRGAGGHAVHLAVRARPAPRHPGQARRGLLVRAARARRRARRRPARSCSATTRARTRTARSPTSPACSASTATSWA